MNDVDAVLDLLRCPQCSRPLAGEAGGLRCAAGHQTPLLPGDIPDLATSISQVETPGQWFMRFPPLVTVYERVWRPGFTALAGGSHPDQETARLVEWLGLAGEATVLDVACGPGNTSRRLARGMASGRVLGVDLSVPMLQQAVAEGDGRQGVQVAYVRGDAHHLAISDASVDGAHCAAALYLVSDPAGVVREMARTLRPGAALVGMTLAPLPTIVPLPVTRAVAGALSGVRYVGADDLRRFFAGAGLTDARVERQGGALLFAARRP